MAKGKDRNEHQHHPYPLPDLETVNYMHPDVVTDQHSYEKFRKFYYTVSPVNWKLIQKFYEPYIKTQKMPGKETPRLYSRFLIKEMICAFNMKENKRKTNATEN